MGIPSSHIAAAGQGNVAAGAGNRRSVLEPNEPVGSGVAIGPVGNAAVVGGDCNTGRLRDAAAGLGQNRCAAKGAGQVGVEVDVRPRDIHRPCHRGLRSQRGVGAAALNRQARWGAAATHNAAQGEGSVCRAAVGVDSERTRAIDCAADGERAARFTFDGRIGRQRDGARDGHCSRCAIEQRTATADTGARHGDRCAEVEASQVQGAAAVDHRRAHAQGAAGDVAHDGRAHAQHTTVDGGAVGAVAKGVGTRQRQGARSGFAQCGRGAGNHAID